MYLKICSLLVIFAAIVSLSEGTQNLQRVFMVFRHGPRGPGAGYNFFPYGDERTYWPEGFGQLTKKGKDEVFNLGSRIRARYVDFLGKHSPKLADDISLVSTDCERCLATAAILLSTFYPPNVEQSYTHKLYWHPVPGPTTSPDRSYLITTRKGCDKYLDEVNKHWESLNSDPLFKEALEVISEFDKENEVVPQGASGAFNFLDFVIAADRNGYQLPEWISKIYPEKSTEINSKGFVAYTGGNDLVKRLFAGPHIQDIVSRINSTLENIKDGTSYSKFYLYAGHDATVFGLLNLLGFKSLTRPDYASTLIFELYSNPDSVKVVYSNGTNFEQHELTIPACGQLYCPVEKFWKIVEPYIPNNWEEECKLTAQAEDRLEL